MLAKIMISGKIISKTGMHIGGASGFSAIGAIDSPVIRDIQTDEPMIPGSSLKGKMRSLLAKQYTDTTKLPVHNSDNDRVRRLFGYMQDGKSGGKQMAFPARLQFSDMFLANKDELAEIGVPTTEVKFENTIHRLTAVANPRQIERSVAGSQFGLNLIYNVVDESEMLEDFETIGQGMKLLTYDYIGGHGSRGYGRICFSDLEVNCVTGECDQDLLDKCAALLKEGIA